METNDLKIILGAGIGGLVLLSVVIMLMMYLYVRKRKASEAQANPERIITKTVVSKEVFRGKAGRILHGESHNDRRTRLKTQRENNSSKNGLVVNEHGKQGMSYENVELVGPKDQKVNNPATDTESPLNVVVDDDDAVINVNVTSTSLYEDVEVENDATPPPANYDDMEENEVTSTSQYDQVELADDATSSLPNDDMEHNVVTPPPSPIKVAMDNVMTSPNDDPYHMEENDMYVSVNDVKLNQEKTIVHYEAESGDIYAGVLKSKKSVIDKSSQ